MRVTGSFERSHSNRKRISAGLLVVLTCVIGLMPAFGMSRTSWDGNTFHNANFLTFHRIMNFRSSDRYLDNVRRGPSDEEQADAMGNAGSEAEAGAADEAVTNKAFRSEFIFTSAPFPSCHASTIVETARHTLVAAWFGGKHEGADDVKIWVSRLENGAWTPPAAAASGVDEAGHPAACYNPVLFQPRGGEPLLLFYKVGHEPAKWRGYVTESDDDGRSWEPGRPLPEGFIGPDKDKPLQLGDGTILCASSTEANGWRVHFEFTDPTAEHWSRTPPVNDAKEIRAIQPSLMAMGGDWILAIGRTAESRLFSIQSTDAGRTWSRMRLLDTPNPNAGIDTVRLRDGRFLLVYNPSTKNRRQLSVAISRDAEHWTKVLDLDHGPLEYSYPSAIQTSDGMVHIVYTWRRKRIRHVVLDPKLLR